MLLDIAKESTDVFPPLKSCLGGINALIKHYEVRSIEYRHDPAHLYVSQQCKDVEDKLGDLIPWLTKLKGTVVASDTNGNYEEAERRKQLTRFVSWFCCLANSREPSVDPWKTLRNNPRRCWEKAKQPGSSIKPKTLERSSSSSRNSDRLSSSTRLALLVATSWA